MAVAYVKPDYAITLTRDKDGHRDFLVSSLVVTDDKGDGPLTALEAPGLYQIGALYQFRNEIDTWAFCHPEAEVRPHTLDEGSGPVPCWLVTQHFRTKPLKEDQCTTNVEDPLCAPQIIYGGSKNKTVEAIQDRFGWFLKTSSYDQVRGPQVEFDSHNHTITVEQNVATLGLEDFSAMINTVNDSVLWGMNPRCIKLNTVSWRRNFGASCTPYYTRVFEFEADSTTFDRWVADESNVVIKGRWEQSTANSFLSFAIPVGEWYYLIDVDADHSMQASHCAYRDKNDEPQKCILNGYGLPANTKAVTQSAVLYKIRVLSQAYLNYPITRHIEIEGTVLTPDILNTTISITNTEGGINAGTYTVVDYIEGTRIAILNSAPGISGEWGKGTINWINIDTGAPGRILVQYYPESNFLELGVPSTF